MNKIIKKKLYQFYIISFAPDSIIRKNWKFACLVLLMQIILLVVSYYINNKRLDGYLIFILIFHNFLFWADQHRIKKKTEKNRNIRKSLESAITKKFALLWEGELEISEGTIKRLIEDILTCIENYYNSFLYNSKNNVCAIIHLIKGREKVINFPYMGQYANSCIDFDNTHEVKTCLSYICYKNKKKKLITEDVDEEYNTRKRGHKYHSLVCFEIISLDIRNKKYYFYLIVDAPTKYIFQKEKLHNYKVNSKTFLLQLEFALKLLYKKI